MTYKNEPFYEQPYFKTLDPKSQKVLLTNYPNGNFSSFIEYKFYPGIKFVVTKDDKTKQIYYL